MTDDLLAQIHLLHDELQRRMRERFDRDLPFDELVFDRWERARRLGFGRAPASTTAPTSWAM